MKRTIAVLLTVISMVTSIISINAYADDGASVAPSLVDITFNNATIDGGFSPEKFDYTITLQDASVTPTLNNYKIKGKANIFVTYSYNSAKQQDGVIATLEYENGSLIYSFKYSNAVQYTNASNLLSSVTCELGEVYPAINDDETAYKLYIPNDLEEIKLTAIPKEIGAFCDAPSSVVLNKDQEPILTINVTASNGEVRRYTLKVKRLSKSCEQVEKLMKQEDFSSIVQGELLHQKPAFRIAIIGSAGGIIVLIAVFLIVKRLSVKASDNDEIEFFN